MAEIDKIKFTVNYSSPTFKFFEPFLSLKDELLNRIAGDENYRADAKSILEGDRNAAEGRLRKLEETLTAGRQLKNCENSDEKALPPYLAEIVSGITGVMRAARTDVYFNVDGRFDVVTLSARGQYSELCGVNFDRGSFVTVRRETNMYGTEKYSVAIRGEKFWLALAAGPSGQKIKTGAVLRVYACDGNGLYADSAAKYFDTVPMLSGLRA